jgi:hypothetical protein
MATPAKPKPAGEKSRKPYKLMTVDEARAEIDKDYQLLHCTGCNKDKWLPAAAIGPGPLPMCKTCRTNGKMSNQATDGYGFGVYDCELCHWKWTSDDPDVHCETATECVSPARKTAHGNEVKCDAHAFPMAVGPRRLKKAYETLWAAERRAAKSKNTKPRHTRARRERDDDKKPTPAAISAAAAAAPQPKMLECYVAPQVQHVFKTYVAPNPMQCADTGRAAALRLSGSAPRKARPAPNKKSHLDGVWKCNRCMATRDPRYNETTDCANCQAVGSLERVAE